MPGHWTDTENDLVVASYLQMLSLELSGTAYVKRENNRRIREHLHRSHGSVEFKWQNVSAVLLGMGLPWIPGYKPAPNFQGSLVDAVVRATHQQPIEGGNWFPRAKGQDSLGSVAEGAERYLGPTPTRPWASPPLLMGILPKPSALAEAAEESRKRVAGFFDPALRDARNSEIGERGEGLVLDFERRRLLAAGRSDLADAVEWSSKERGDGLGFDISSFTVDGEPRELEVKTTPGWATTPFHISRNEREVADANADRWRLVRVWDVARVPRAFVVTPPLDRLLEMSATSYRAHLKAI